jgi:hypothetical protein
VIPILNRPFAPKAGPDAYQTYQVLQPAATHFRRGTCAEVDCRRLRDGWVSRADVSTVDGQKIANWIRLHSGRKFTVAQAGTIVTFTFAAGQRCFARHRVSLHREPVLRVAGGDWRGNPRETPTRVYRAADWLDHFGTHQLSLVDAQKRG